MSKILVICGPTATGKTTLALFLAKKFHADLLSADSRQVYKGMDIVTGKDLPVNVKLQITNVKWGRKKIGFWETPDGVRIWLTDLVEPTENFSVSQWVHTALKVLDFLKKEKKLPIIVGVTGFYIKTLVDGIETMDVPPNYKLRLQLSDKKIEELYEILSRVDAFRASNMNQSDRKNPRRLIRAIEIAFWQSRHKAPVPEKLKADVLMIGLTAPREVLYKKIDERVEERIKQGAVGETKRLLTKSVSWDMEPMTGTGYRQLKSYFNGKITLKEVIERWKIAEHHDSKKQMTWFKGDKRIVWFDITEPSWKRQVEKLVGNWYHIFHAEDN